MRRPVQFLVICSAALLGLAAKAGATPPCRPLAEAERDGALRQLAVAPEHAASFRPVLCRITLSRRLAILTYQIDGLELRPTWDQPSADPRYPMPLLLRDGRPAGRLPEHVPAEYPLDIAISTVPSGSALPRVLCLRATTAAEGNPPRYPAMVWDGRQYRQTRQPTCR